MKRSQSVTIGCLLGAAVGLGWAAGSAGFDEVPVAGASQVAVAQADQARQAENDAAEPAAPTPLALFMRKKLDASSLILEGLLVEDPRMMLKGAEQLRKMSEAEQWRVSNDAVYRNHSDDFQSRVDKLVVASKGTSLDRAALSWFDTTLSCIDCHRYVRTMLVADSNAPLTLPMPAASRQ